MSSPEQTPENHRLGADDIPPNLSLTETYAEFVRRVQEDETVEMWRARSEAWQACYEALPEACERQEFDAAYDLAIINRQLRSWRPSIRLEAGERLEAMFEVLAEWDHEFALLYERYEDLEEAGSSLDEQHAEEKWSAGVKPRRPLSGRILHLLRKTGAVLSELPRR